MEGKRGLMSKIWIFLLSPILVVLSVSYLWVFVGEQNLKVVEDNKLSFEKAVSILGAPDQMEESQIEVTGCGLGSRSIHYYYSRTALILRFEDTVSIVFDINGNQCAFIRTSI